MRIKLLVTALAVSLNPLLSTAKNDSAPTRLPEPEMSFLENVGQVKDQYAQARNDIQFSLRGNGLNVFIGNGALHYQFAKNNNPRVIKDPRVAESKGMTEMYRLDVELVNANKKARIITKDKQSNYTTFHLPGVNDAVAHTYKKITYKDIYPHIDWVLYIKNGVLEYEFEIKKDGNPTDIKLRYAGANSIVKNADGSIDITTPMGNVKEHTPYTYTPGGKEVKSSFKLEGAELSFDVAAYKGEIVIDPILSWGTYYGGSVFDYSEGVTVDASGNIYMCGYSESTNNIATVGAFQTVNAGGYDCFIAKFNSTGVRQWATYYGSTNNDYLFSVACNQQGDVYASGRSESSSGVATPGAHQTVMYGLSDAILMKMTSAGQLTWCTYYGGFSNEFGYAVGCDGNGDVYLSGSTSSANNIGTAGTHQAFQFGGYQAFLAKFNSGGTRQWGTYFGGTSDDYGYGMCIDAANFIYICGRATSIDYINSINAYQTFNAGGNDGFIAKFRSTDGKTSWSTYYGDAGDDQLFGIACDGDANVYICGQTDGTSTIATALSHQDTYGGGLADAFLAKFDSAGARQWATYYGGSSDDYGQAVTCDQSNNIYITGHTNSTDNIATANTYQNSPGGQVDAFLAKFNDAGVIDWGTYYGGSLDENSHAIASAGGYEYICGYTESSTQIATNAAQQNTLGGNLDGFLAKFGECVAPNATFTAGGPLSFCTGDSVVLTASTGDGYTYKWRRNNIDVPNATDTTYTATLAGNYTVIVLTACGNDTSTASTVTVHPLPVAVVTQLNNQLSTTSFTSYQWYHDGQAINNATNQNHTATQNGDYHVRVTDGNGCGANSDTVTVTGLHISSISGDNPSLDVNLSPNPNNGVFNLQGSVAAEKLLVTITDVTGRVMLVKESRSKNGTINEVIKLEANTPAGMYIIKVTAGDNNTVMRLLKK